MLHILQLLIIIHDIFIYITLIKSLLNVVHTASLGQRMGS